MPSCACHTVPEVNVTATVLGGLGRAVGAGVSRLLRRPSSDDPFVPVATWKAGQTPQQVCALGWEVVWGAVPYRPCL
jgi:hypothetical protein